jgi:hypothetical protein
VSISINISSMAGRQRDAKPQNIRFYNLYRSAHGGTQLSDCMTYDTVIRLYDIMIPTVQFHSYSQRILLIHVDCDLVMVP